MPASGITLQQAQQVISSGLDKAEEIGGTVDQDQAVAEAALGGFHG